MKTHLKKCPVLVDQYTQYDALVDIEQDYFLKPLNVSPYEILEEVLTVFRGNDPSAIHNIDAIRANLQAQYEHYFADTPALINGTVDIQGSFSNVMQRIMSLAPKLSDELGNPIKYYFTHANSISSDFDPINDRDEVVGPVLGVVGLGSDPMVAAHPVIKVGLKSYTLTPRETITDSSGGFVRDTVQHSVKKSSSKSRDWDASISITKEFSLTPKVTVSPSFSYGESYTSSEEISNSETNSSQFDWNTASTVDSQCAADITFTLTASNVGDTLATDVKFAFTLTLGGQALPTQNNADNLLDLSPLNDPIELTFEQCVNLSQLKALQLGGKVNIITEVLDANVAIQGLGQEEWNLYDLNMLAKNATIDLDIVDAYSNRIKRSYNVALGATNSLTVRDVLKKLLGNLENCDETSTSQLSSFCERNGILEIRDKNKTFFGSVVRPSVGTILTGDAKIAEIEKLLPIENLNVLDLPLQALWEYHFYTTPEINDSGESSDGSPEFYYTQLIGDTLVVGIQDELAPPSVKVCAGNTCKIMESPDNHNFVLDLKSLGVEVKEVTVIATNSRGETTEFVKAIKEKASIYQQDNYVGNPLKLWSATHNVTADDVKSLKVRGGYDLWITDGGLYPKIFQADTSEVRIPKSLLSRLFDYEKKYRAFAKKRLRNVALGKKTSQSSNYGTMGIASNAVDGNTDGNWINSSVTHTKPDGEAWWQVELGREYPVNRVVIWNRTDCCSDRLSQFNVSLFDEKGNKIANQYVSSLEGSYISLNFDDVLANRVKVQLVGTNALSLAEVQVFAEDGNLALNRPTIQSNTLYNGISSRAVDGNASGLWSKGSISHTDARPGASWWKVDLQDEYLIDEVVIWNRTDECCINRLAYFNVELLDDDNNVVTTQTVKTLSGPYIRLNFNGVNAHKVRVSLNATYVNEYGKTVPSPSDGVLSIAEIEVFEASYKAE